MRRLHLLKDGWKSGKSAAHDPGKNLGKYSFRNAEGNWPISTDIGILKEYYYYTLVNIKYYL